MNDFAHGPSTIRIGGDLEVSRLGFGAMQLPGPGVWGEPKNPDGARAVLKRVVELGINLIDTSWYYGPHVSNRLIAETLHPYPKGLVIATKLGGMRTPDKGWGPFIKPEQLREGCETDLKSLKLERLDIVHLRWLDAGVPFLEALDAMIALKKEGKIRHIGISSINPAQLKQALERTEIVDVQNLYNVAAGEKKLSSIPHMDVEGQEQLVDACEKNKLAFMPFFPLAIPSFNGPGPKFENAALTAAAKNHKATEAQIAIAWLLARSKTMLPIPGTSSVAHLEENWAARKIELSPEEIKAIGADRN
jgi:aryl-alcohol dehydrogenase-like predicted oxidoreductase